jgi:hypothetical protein
MLPLPINPKPPALLTALAKRQPLAQIMPPWMMGFSMLKSCVIELENTGLIQKLKVKNKKTGFLPQRH